MTQVTYKPVSTGLAVKPLDPPDENWRKWLHDQATDLTWLLAHTYSGVVWGKYNGGWQLSSGLIDESPELHTSTLLQLRAFGEKAEVFVWREDADTLRARLFREPDVALTEKVDYYDERQILWGTYGEALEGTPFTFMEDGRQGLRHAVPLTVPDAAFDKDQEAQEQSLYRPLRLVVRHYLGKHEETGLAGIAFSRLVDLTWETQSQSKQENA